MNDTNPRRGFDLFKVWKEYEALAIHFNDLLIRLRSQSLAAVATFATASGVLLSSNLMGQNFRWVVLTIVFFFLSLFWFAIGSLDLLYYNQLLLGAVQALKRIERISKEKDRIEEIDISTKIEKSLGSFCKCLGQKNYFIRCKGVLIFYSTVLLLLLSSFAVALVMTLYGIDEVRRVMRGSFSAQHSNNATDQPVFRGRP